MIISQRFCAAYNTQHLAGMPCLQLGQSMMVIIIEYTMCCVCCKVQQ